MYRISGSHVVLFSPHIFLSSTNSRSYLLPWYIYVYIILYIPMNDAPGETSGSRDLPGGVREAGGDGGVLRDCLPDGKDEDLPQVRRVFVCLRIIRVVIKVIPVPPPLYSLPSSSFPSPRALSLSPTSTPPLYFTSSVPYPFSFASPPAPHPSPRLQPPPPSPRPLPRHPPPPPLFSYITSDMIPVLFGTN